MSKDEESNVGSKLEELNLQSNEQHVHTTKWNKTSHNPFIEPLLADGGSGTSGFLKAGKSTEIPSDPLTDCGVLDDGGDCTDENDKVNNVSGLKGAQSTNEFALKVDKKHVDPQASSLYKASSVPHLHSTGSKLKLAPTGSQRRKKTSEASPLNDPAAINKLLSENEILKDKVARLEEDKKQITSINHAWDAQYNMLIQKHTTLQQEFGQSKEDFNNIITNMDKELTTKDKKITRLTNKIELLINSCEEDDGKPLWKQVDEKESMPSSRMTDDMILTNDFNYAEELSEMAKLEMLYIEEKEGRKTALIQVKELQVQCQYLDKTLAQQTQQRMYLQTELQRLSSVIERKHPAAGSTRKSSTQSNEAQTLRNTGVADEDGDKNDVEILKQQLLVYAEDFNAEKEDKQRLIQETEELKKIVNNFKEEKETLLRQLKIYEEDFHSEREKRINLMRRIGPLPQDEYARSSRSSNMQPPPPVEDSQHKWKEYCCLVVERDQLADRINELETQGVTRYTGRTQNPPSYQTYLPRGRPSKPPSTSSHMKSGMDLPNFYGERVVRDSHTDWPLAMYSGGNRTPSESDSRLSSRRNPKTSHSPLHYTQSGPGVH